MSAADNKNKAEQVTLKVPVKGWLKSVLLTPGLRDIISGNAAMLSMSMDSLSGMYADAIAKHKSRIESGEERDREIAEFLLQIAEIPYKEILKLVDFIWHPIMERNPDAALELMSATAELSKSRLEILALAELAQKKPDNA